MSAPTVQTVSARGCYQSARECDMARERTEASVARLRAAGKTFAADWMAHEVLYWNRMAGAWYMVGVRKAAIDGGGR